MCQFVLLILVFQWHMVNNCHAIENACMIPRMLGIATYAASLIQQTVIGDLFVHSSGPAKN